MAFENVVERNPVDSGGFHGNCGDTATHQPFGHFLQVCRKSWENSYRIFIAVRRHGNKDFPQNGAIARRSPSVIPFLRLARLLPAPLFCFPASPGCFF